MAHNVEPMDIDNDFDNKENTFHHGNMLPCTEKGYEELDVSELNMKLRYSTTPASSPMSKSYTANCLDNVNLESGVDSNALDNLNLSRSFNTMMNKNDNMSKSFKAQPLHLNSVEQSLDNNRNMSVLRPLDTTVTSECNKIIVTTTEANDNNDSSFPSSPSSIALTPEQTKEIPRNDGGSPIMRGLKSVLNMFRSSQSPIPSTECDDNVAKHDICGPGDTNLPNSCGQKPQAALASTPIKARKSKDRTPSKRNSPHKDSVVFNDDLEKELLWKDETTILFDEEKIPIHKLFFQQTKPLHSIQTKVSERNVINQDLNENFNETAEFMDVSYNDAEIQDKTIMDLQVDPSKNNVAESDGEFVDCENTFTNHSDLLVGVENKCDDNIVSVESVAMSIMCNVTQEIGSKCNKTVELLESQPTITSVIFNKEPIDKTISLELADKSATSVTFTKEHLDATVTLDSGDGLITSKTFIKDNREVVTPQSELNPNSSKGQLDATVVIDQAKNKTVVATFIKEVQSNISLLNSTEKTPSTFSENINEEISGINKTMIYESSEESIPSCTFTKDIPQDIASEVNANQLLNVTMTLDLAKMSASHEDTKNNKDQCNENYGKVLLDTTVSNEKPPLPVTHTNYNSQEIKALYNENISDKHVGSLDSDKISVSEVEECVSVDIAKDILDGTIVIDQIDKNLLSDTFTKNNTEDIKNESGAEYLQTPLNSTMTIASKDKAVMSATFIRDATEDRYFHCIDNSAKEHMNASKPIECIEKLSDVDVNHSEYCVDMAVNLTGNSPAYTALYKDNNISYCEIDTGILSVQNVDGNVHTIHSSNVISELVENADIEPHVPTDSNNTFEQMAIKSTEQCKVNNDKENIISHSKIEPKSLYVENVNQNNHTKSQNSSKILSEMFETIEIKPHVHTDNSNTFDLGQIAIENTEQHKNSFLNTVQNQVRNSVTETSTLNPDILPSSTYENITLNDITNKRDVDKVEQIFNKDNKNSSETSMIHYIPADIPLPEENDTEIEVVTESLIKDNKRLSMVLPDVINIHTSIAEDVDKVDDVPIDISTQVKLTADLINDTLLDKESVANTIKIEEITNLVQNDESIQATIECKLEDQQFQDQLYEMAFTPPIESVEATENLTDNTKRNVLANKPSVCDNSLIVSDDISVNNNIDQQISLNIELDVAKAKNNLDSVEKINIEKDIIKFVETLDTPMDINSSTLEVNIEKKKLHNNKPEVATSNKELKENIIKSVETQETPMDINSSILKVNTEKSILHDIKPEVTASSQELKGDELQHCYETESHSNDLISLPQVCQNDVYLENKQVNSTLQINESKDIEKISITIHTTKNNIKNEETLCEEIIDSQNNSSYMQISVNKEPDSDIEINLENIVNPFTTKSKVSITPPATPKIVSKGYNLDFDDIEDPFATKLKIRMSPPLESPKTYKSVSAKKATSSRPELFNNNIRKNQSERKKAVSTKKTDNASLDAFSPKLNKIAAGTHDNSELQENYINKYDSNLTNLEVYSKEVSDCTTSDLKIKDIAIDLNAIDKSELEVNIDNTSKLDVVSVAGNERVENKSPIISSSEQSAYYSAATSSDDSVVTRNVFNLPEIDDMNFNPFATKSKMRQSPPPVGNMTPLNLPVAMDKNTPNAIKDIYINQIASNNELGVEEKASVSNLTVQEVHTDDEDTLEGPFLEGEELENDKSSDVDNANIGIDMMQFTDLPAETNDDNELFIDAEAFEFLLNQNKSNVVVDSGKESLFLKFDPLFAKRISSDGVVAALSKIHKLQSSPKKILKSSQRNIKTGETPIAGTSNSNISLKQNASEESVEDTNIITSKPMMVVTPAVNPVVTPRKLMTPTSSNRRSITFTSPAIAVIDRLLSLSANNSLVGDDTTVTQASREQNEANLALTQLRELLAEKEVHVYNLRSESKELKDRLTTLETQMKSLQSQSDERLKKVNELTVKLSEKTKINKSMATVVEEYERTIASLIAETEQDKKRHNDERIMLIKERDEQTAHLASMEVSFSDLHTKYEKSKQLIFSCKANEDTYKKNIKDFEESFTKMQKNYELLKQHATSKLNHANQELEKMNRAHEAEVLKLNAMIKRKDLHITSLEETLAQKTKANEELTAICDELINKVG